MDRFGYTISFLALGAAATVSRFAAFMPETRNASAQGPESGTSAIEGAPGE